MTEEREIDLRELFHSFLKRWRSIILLGVIIAVLAGGIKLGLGLHNTLNKDARIKEQNKYESSLEQYNTKGEALKSELEAMELSAERQSEYNENSLLMKIDPMKKYIGSITIYIDSQYQIDPSLSYQNIDNTSRLVKAYSAYVANGELYNYILNHTKLLGEVRYLTEILSYTADKDASSITVTCVGSTLEDVHEIMDIVKSGLNEKYPEINAAIGDHTYSIIMETVYTAVDLALDKTQKENIQTLADYNDDIVEMSKELDTWSKEKPQPQYGYKRTVINGIKYGLLGGAAGIIATAVYWAVAFILTRRIQDDASWKALRIMVLGIVQTEKKKKAFHKVDNWIDKTMGYENDDIDFESSCELTAVNIGAVMSKRNLHSVAIVSIADEKVTEDTINMLMKKNAEVQFINVGNVLTTSAAVKEFTDDNFVIIAKSSANTIDEVNRVKTLASAWGKELLGAIVIK